MIIRPEEITVGSKEEIVAKVVEGIVKALNEAISKNGRARLVLAGGSTFKPVYQILASPEYIQKVDWSKVELFFGDERCVPQDHADSNYRAVTEDLKPLLEGGKVSVRRMKGELPPQLAIGDYTAALRSTNEGQLPIFDLVLLGIGKDGHTASLFPGSLAAIVAFGKEVAHTEAELAPFVGRLTLTPQVLQNSGFTIVMAAGEEKAAILPLVLQDEQGKYPFYYLRPLHGTWHFFLDTTAAKFI